MTWRTASRREDERALHMLALRRDGVSTGVLGRLFGMSDSAGSSAATSPMERRTGRKSSG